MSRADMESASPHRYTLQEASKLPEELSALCGMGGTRLTMLVDQTRCKGELVGREGGAFVISTKTRLRRVGSGKAHARAMQSDQPLEPTCSGSTPDSNIGRLWKI